MKKMKEEEMKREKDKNYMGRNFGPQEKKQSSGPPAGKKSFCPPN
jgi:hypothetical protein